MNSGFKMAEFPPYSLFFFFCLCDFLGALSAIPLVFGIHLHNIRTFVVFMDCKNYEVVNMPSFGRLGSGKTVA